MKNIIKKINSAILAAALLISTLPAAVSYAAELKIPEWNLTKGTGSDIQLDEEIALDGASLKLTSASSASAVTYVAVEGGKNTN